MAGRHPLPYAFAKAHTLLLEDDGAQLVLWAADATPPGALTEVTRLWAVERFEHEDAAVLAQRIAAAYAGAESSAAVVIGEVESAVDLSRLMQDLPAVEDLLEASNDAPIIRMLNALLTQAVKDGASDIHIEPYERASAVRFRVDGALREVVQPNRALHAALISRLKIMAAAPRPCRPPAIWCTPVNLGHVVPQVDVAAAPSISGVPSRPGWCATPAQRSMRPTLPAPGPPGPAESGWTPAARVKPVRRPGRCAPTPSCRAARRRPSASLPPWNWPWWPPSWPSWSECPWACMRRSSAALS